MTKKQEKELVASFKEYSKEILSSKENSQKFLIELGICTKNGNLTHNYR
ncbi:MAG TPA: hypothetical protein PK252_11720 [Bacteroidales bacterium]|nr:hypothetical protein [Bacteroidales bacterium]